MIHTNFKIPEFDPTYQPREGSHLVPQGQAGFTPHNPIDQPTENSHLESQYQAGFTTHNPTDQLTENSNLVPQCQTGFNRRYDHEPKENLHSHNSNNPLFIRQTRQMSTYDRDRHMYGSADYYEYKNAMLHKKDRNKVKKDFDVMLSADLTGLDREMMSDLIDQYADMFATDLKQLGCTNNYKHHIDTLNAKPIQQNPTPFSPDESKFVDYQVQEMLNANLIQPSASKWVSPAVLLKRKGLKYQFTVDYRKLNKVTVPLTYPICGIDQVFRRIDKSDARIFSILDMGAGFGQILLDLETSAKTAFVTPRGVYEFIKMPSGLKNGQSSYVMAVEDILKDVTNAAVHGDHVLVHSQTFIEHLKDLEKVFEYLQNAFLCLRPEHCQFGLTKLKYLDQEVSDRVDFSEAKAHAVSNFPKPEKMKDMKNFLSLTRYYSHFIDRFDDITKPITDLVQGQQVKWGSRQDRAFNTLKTALTTEPIFKPEPDQGQLIIYTDMSNRGLGYILGQKDKAGREHVLAYGGRQMRHEERLWSTTEKECLAIIEAVKHFNVFLASDQPFVIITDHESLEWLGQSSKDSDRLHRWALELQQFKYHIVSRPGELHCNADGLSRKPFKTRNDATEVSLNTIQFPMMESTLVSGAEFDSQSPSEYIQSAKELGFSAEKCDISENDRNELLILIGKHKDIFAKGLSNLGVTDIHYHTIDTRYTQPKASNQPRNMLKTQQQVENYVQILLSHGLVQPSKSQWRAGIVFVNGIFQFDFTTLNKHTKSVSTSVPTPENVLENIVKQEACYFSVLDFDCGVFQIPLDPLTARKTAFKSMSGIYEFKTLPPGLKNSATSLGVILKECMKDIDPECAALYNGAIILYNQDFNSHLKLLHQIFAAVRNTGMHINATNSQFATQKIDFLGCTFSGKEHEIQKAKTATLLRLRNPQNIQELKVFRNLCKYYKYYMKDFMHKLAPLENPIGTNWSEDVSIKRAFEALKHALVSPPITLKQPLKTQYIVYVNSTQEAIGYILGQKDEAGFEHMVASGGRTLNYNEQKTDATCRECLALVEATRKFRPYLLDDRPFVLYSDRSLLQEITDTQVSSANPMSAYLLELQTFKFQLVKRKKENFPNVTAFSHNYFQKGRK